MTHDNIMTANPLILLRFNVMKRMVDRHKYASYLEQRLTPDDCDRCEKLLGIASVAIERTSIGNESSSDVKHIIAIADKCTSSVVKIQTADFVIAYALVRTLRLIAQDDESETRLESRVLESLVIDALSLISEDAELAPEKQRVECDAAQPPEDALIYSPLIRLKLCLLETVVFMEESGLTLRQDGQQEYVVRLQRSLSLLKRAVTCCTRSSVGDLVKITNHLVSDIREAPMLIRLQCADIALSIVTVTMLHYAEGKMLQKIPSGEEKIVKSLLGALLANAHRLISNSAT